jgi:pimeloyl-ACP methyl ester carboxylesterase
MADGDYERGRGREIDAIAAELKRLRNGRDARCPSVRNGQDARCPSAGAAALVAAVWPPVFVLNGWAASPHAWDLCEFMRPQQIAALPRLFSYVEQLDGEPEKAIENVERCILVGWSMGGSSALRLAARWPEKIVGLVLIAATPRMMEEKESGWRGMSPHRLEALRYGLLMTKGMGVFGVPEGKPNPYLADEPVKLERGLQYLLETDLRANLEALRTTKHEPRSPFPVHIFQSERDGIVRAANADYLKKIFPQASVTMVPGAEHALSIFIPELIDEAVDSCLRLAAAGQDPA